MLNLSQVKFQVKTADMALIPNPNHPAGTGLAYRQLKEAGWRCYDSSDRQGMEVHPVDRVPVFRLGAASIRRNKSGSSHWLIEVGDQTFEASEGVGEITAAVKAKLATLRVNPEPQPEIENPKSKIQNSSIAARIALDLKAEYPEMSPWIDRGLALVERGETSFPHYNTRYDPATVHGNRDCDCQARAPRAKFGKACKHCLAQEIAHRVEAEATATAYRRLTDKIEGKRTRERALPAERRETAAEMIRRIEAENAAKFAARNASYDTALRPDPLNQKRGHYNERGQWNAHGN